MFIEVLKEIYFFTKLLIDLLWYLVNSSSKCNIEIKKPNQYEAEVIK